MENNNQLQSKLNKIFFLFIFLLFVLCVRLIHLQVHLGKKLYSQGQKNFLRINKVTPTRGNIVDSNGKLLATNKPIHNLYWIGHGKANLSEKDLKDLYLLEKILDPSSHDNLETSKILPVLYNKLYKTIGKNKTLKNTQELLIAPPMGNSHIWLSDNTGTSTFKSTGAIQTKNTDLIEQDNRSFERKKLTDPETLDKIKKANKYNKKLLIASELTFDQLSQIEEQFGKNPSILIETSFKRFYPYQSFASHTLGFLGRMDIDNIGKMGLEKLLEESLKGTDGSKAVKINSFGTTLSENIIQNALSGQNIKINLDIELQEIIEDAFPQGSTGSLLLMDPYDGSILALLSRPNFDPNIFLSPISKPEWDMLQENNPFQNRAFSSAYPPGSIFKIVTMSLALDNKLVTENETCHCCGYINFGNRKCYCNNHDGHGLLNAKQAFEQSCNIFFYKIAKKMDIDQLANYSKRFGLGEKTNTIFPETIGIVPTKAWKKQTKGERWYKGENLSAAIGQGFLSVTPIQAARMASSVYAGYLVNPRILEQEPIIKTPLNISSSTLKFLRDSMKRVVTHGTARSINRGKDFEIYAKTGTAQTSDLTKREMGNIYREHKWLIGTFKYKENKPITFVILIENAESPSLSSQAINKLLNGYKKLTDKRANPEQAKISPTQQEKTTCYQQAQNTFSRKLDPISQANTQLDLEVLEFGITGSTSDLPTAQE